MTDIPIVPLGIKPSLQTFQQFAHNDKQLISNYNNLGYDRVLLPITNTKYRDLCKQIFKQYSSNDDDDEEEDENDEIIHDFEIPFPDITQVNILQGDHTTCVVGLISSWIELDTSNQFINEFSARVLHNELSYANFLGLELVLIAPPKNLNNLSIFTNNLHAALTRFPNVRISISLPICEENITHPVTGEVMTPVIDSLSTWDMWNSIRLQCHYHRNLTVSLALPKNNIPQYVITRWVLEPISIFLISTTTFVKNSKNYPVLNKFNQIILWKFIQKHWSSPPMLLLHGVDKFSSPPSPNLQKNAEIHPMVTANNHDIYLGDMSYYNYLKYISQVTADKIQISALELVSNKFFHGTDKNKNDLQTPLQPLHHELDNKTYRVFENDVVKYDQYEAAITQALIDIGEPQQVGQKIQVLVVGPGRGPLIDRIISASARADRKRVKITAVEKNPAVMVYLQQKAATAWRQQDVEIIHGDAREFQHHRTGMEKFQLCISELLGSFGDNELSPECLYPLQAKHCSQDCIYIPCEVSTYMAPAISPSTHSKILHEGKNNLFHKPYLVRLNQFEILSSKFHPVWSFTHPHMAQPRKKFNKVSFKCRHKGLIHGIVGCFDACLYGDIRLSNNPTHPSPPDLTSWLPIFFPLESPVFLSDDQEVEILMKRDHDGARVWYEWCCESFIYLILPPAKKQAKLAAAAAAAKELAHNSVFGGGERQRSGVEGVGGGGGGDEDEGECQVRVRTGVSRIHNQNGAFYSMRL